MAESGGMMVGLDGVMIGKQGRFRRGLRSQSIL